MCRYDNGDIMDVDWNLVLDLREIFVTENVYKLFIHYDITVWFYVFFYLYYKSLRINCDLDSKHINSRLQ